MPKELTEEQKELIKQIKEKDNGFGVCTCRYIKEPTISVDEDMDNVVKLAEQMHTLNDTK